MIFNAPNSAAPGRGFRLVVGVVILLLGTAGSVRAAPLSRGGVFVADDGTVLLAGARVGTLALPPPPRHLDVSRHTLGRHHLLHVRVVGRGDRSFDLLLELRPGSPKVVFSGSTGPRGV
ncbi:MAG: hypothetical protein KAI47_03900, partial [Deltaproteobacteria bacterium]|nr:hypothetical protein [Deltaproteobacteria bacterium]